MEFRFYQQHTYPHKLQKIKPIDTLNYRGRNLKNSIDAYKLLKEYVEAREWEIVENKNFREFKANNLSTNRCIFFIEQRL